MLWLGGVTMMVTMQLRLLTSSQWIYDEAGSAVEGGIALAILGAIQFVQMPVALYGGALADVLDRKKLMASTQFVAFPSLLLLAIAAATDNLAPWHIYVVTGVSGIVNMLGNSARPAMLPRVVPRPYLTNAVTIQTSSFQAGQIGAPFLFWWLYVGFGAEAAFGVGAVIAGISFLSPLLIRASGDPGGALRRVTVQSLMEGFRFVKGHPILPGLYALDIGVTVFSFYRQLLPLFADQLYGLGAAGTAALGSANSFGGIAGSMLVFVTEKAKRKGRIVLYATLAYALLLFAFGLNPIFWLGLLLIGALGAMDSIGMTMRQAVVQLTTPERLIGRASSAHSFAAMGANHAGQLEVALMAAAIGAGGAMVVGGFVAVAAVLAVWYFMPGVWRYRYDPSADVEAMVGDGVPATASAEKSPG